MSYIFEALKRVEQKRQHRGASRLLMATGELASERRKRRHLWPILVLAILLLLNAAAMTWWVRPWSHEKPTASPEPVTRHTQEASMTATEASSRVNDKAREQNRAVSLGESQEKKSASAQKNSRRSTVRVAGTESLDTVHPKVAPEPGPELSAPQARSESETATDGRLVDFKELPPAIKNSLPPFKISAHYYTPERQARFTRINEQTLREGQALNQDVKLEEITPDGAILSSKGRRFRIGINEGP